MARAKHARAAMNREQYVAFLHKHSYVNPYYSGSGGERYQIYNEYNEYSKVILEKEEGSEIALTIARDVEKFWLPKTRVFCGFFHETQTFSIEFGLCDEISVYFRIGNNPKYHQDEVGSQIAKTIVKYVDKMNVEVLGKVFSAMCHYKIDAGLLAEIIDPFVHVDKFSVEESARKCLHLAVCDKWSEIYLKKLEDFEVRLGEKQIEYFNVLEGFEIPYEEMKVCGNPVSFILFVGLVRYDVCDIKGIRKRQIQYFLRHQDGVFRRLLHRVARNYLLFFLTPLPKDVHSEVVCLFTHLYLL